MNTEVEKPSLIRALAKNYEMDPQEFFRVIKATIMPAEATPEQTAAFLMVAKEYGLSPLLKEIHAFKNKKTGGIVPVISIDGWSTMVNRHPQFDGVEFDYNNGENGVESITCRIWRKDRTKPIVVTEFMHECRRSSDAWDQTPTRMLRHRAFMQGARLAFGFSGAYDEDAVDYAPAPVDVTPKDKEVIEQAKPKPPAAPKKRPPAAPQKSLEKPKEERTQSEVTEPADDPDAFVERLIAALDECADVEAIDELVDNLDVAARLTNDPDALDMAEVAIAAAKNRLQAAS